MPSPWFLRRPDLFVAIGGGGFFPARVMRTFCKVQGGKNIPIQAIGLSLYEQMGGTDMTAEQIGKEVVRTQWLDFSTLGKTPLLGRRILIVVSGAGTLRAHMLMASCATGRSRRHENHTGLHRQGVAI